MGIINKKLVETSLDNIMYVNGTSKRLGRLLFIFWIIQRDAIKSGNT
jgi:hypothetical protein